jgi:hypothetical protein
MLGDQVPGGAADMGRPKNFALENLDHWRRLPNFFVVRNERRQEDNMTNRGRAIEDNVYDLNAILHPGSVYEDPRDVLADEELTVAEKRSILASWASDASALTSYPALRTIPGQRQPVSIDEILEALSGLDNGPRPPGGKPVRRQSTSRVSEAA